MYNDKEKEERSRNLYVLPKSREQEMSVADSEEVTKTEGMERVMRASKLRNKGWFRDIESVMITKSKQIFNLGSFLNKIFNDYLLNQNFVFFIFSKLKAKIPSYRRYNRKK